MLGSAICEVTMSSKAKACELLHLFGMAPHALIISEVPGPDSLLLRSTAAIDLKLSDVCRCSKRRKSARSSRRRRKSVALTSRQPASQRWARLTPTIGPTRLSNGR